MNHSALNEQAVRRANQRHFCSSACAWCKRKGGARGVCVRVVTLNASWHGVAATPRRHRGQPGIAGMSAYRSVAAASGLGSSMPVSVEKAASRLGSFRGAKRWRAARVRDGYGLSRQACASCLSRQLCFRSSRSVCLSRQLCFRLSRPVCSKFTRDVDWRVNMRDFSRRGTATDGLPLIQPPVDDSHGAVHAPPARLPCRCPPQPCGERSASGVCRSKAVTARLRPHPPPQAV